MPRIQMPPSRLAELRRVKGWSLRDLSKHSGVDFASLRMYELRMREPLVSTAMKLVRLFEGDLRFEDLALSTPLKDKRRKQREVSRERSDQGDHARA
jgi:transcriptional regulator with XRE-family HTH domain